MDALTSYLVAEIAKAYIEGNLLKGLGFTVFFIVIWLEVRGMKKQLKTLNASFDTFGKKLAEGETRFENIENVQREFEHRLTLLEPPKLTTP